VNYLVSLGSLLHSYLLIDIVWLVIITKVCHYGARQSSPSMILISLGSGVTVLTEASSMTWKNTSAGIGVL
jgi:hypothetical protein